MCLNSYDNLPVVVVGRGFTSWSFLFKSISRGFCVFLIMTVWVDNICQILCHLITNYMYIVSFTEILTNFYLFRSLVSEKFKNKQTLWTQEHEIIGLNTLVIYWKMSRIKKKKFITLRNLQINFFNTDSLVQFLWLMVNLKSIIAIISKTINTVDYYLYLRTDK